MNDDGFCSPCHRSSASGISLTSTTTIRRWGVTWFRSGSSSGDTSREGMALHRPIATRALDRRHRRMPAVDASDRRPPARPGPCAR